MGDLPALLSLPLPLPLPLPVELNVDILSRLPSDHLARSRIVSKTFSEISTEVRSVNLLCPLDRYTNPGRLITPFKKGATKYILSLKHVDSISIGVEERANHKYLDKKLDDLHLTEESFVGPLLKKGRGELASLSISDYRLHSHGQWSWVLFSISMFCPNLRELELKNAWLTTKGLDAKNAMLRLTSLKLEFVRLDDEDLDKVNSCFPSLQILHLIGVEGLKNPQIDLFHLKAFEYKGSGLATIPPLQLRRAPEHFRVNGMGPWIRLSFKDPFWNSF